MRNKVKNICCLLLAVLWTASFSMMAYASDSGETAESAKSPLAFTPDGNLTLIDDFLQIESSAAKDTAQIAKQFITVQSKNGNTFYIVIDRNGETENVYFLNLIDEADLMALMEDENGEMTASSCSCTEKCVVGAVNTNCAICRFNMSECIGKEAVAEVEPTDLAEKSAHEKKSANSLLLIILLIAGAGGGAVYWFKFKNTKTKTSGGSDLDDYDFGEDEEIEFDDDELLAESEDDNE